MVTKCRTFRHLGFSKIAPNVTGLKKKFNNYRDILKEPESNWLVYSITKLFGHAGEP